MALAWWTVARAGLIAPPMLIVGVPWKRAVAGSVLASVLISLCTYIRISSAAAAAAVPTEAVKR